MLGRLSAGLYRHVNWKWVITAIVVFGCFTPVILPWQAEKSKEATGGGASPDSSFLYSADELYKDVMLTRKGILFDWLERRFC